MLFSAQFGFHPGGWGKPPVDEFNRPLYGDVFGIVQPQAPPDVCFVLYIYYNI